MTRVQNPVQSSVYSKYYGVSCNVLYKCTILIYLLYETLGQREDLPMSSLNSDR